MKETRLLLLLFFILISSCQEKKPATQEKQASTPKPPFAVGFKIIKATDTTRIYKPNTKKEDKLHFRPLDIDIWYPAMSASNDSVLIFKNILGLLEKRANFYSAPKTYPNLTQDVAKSFAEGFGCSNPDSLLNYPTNSLKNATNAAGKFPLIIYLASFNAMSYDNYVLLEDLARQGYVVACVSSIGKYPGDMTMKTADLMEQVQDAAFTLNQMKQFKFVDSARIGVVGYSWGGLAGSILAMTRPEIDALISLDGSEFHRYGSSKEEDADFDATIKSASFQNATIKIPYLRLESAREATAGDNNKPIVYNFNEKLAGKKQLYTIKGANHQDFSCLPTVVKASGHCKTTPTYRLISNLTIQYFNEQLRKDKNAFQRALQPELDKTVIPLLTFK